MLSRTGRQTSTACCAMLCYAAPRLEDEVSEVFGIFFLIYRCAVGFAILSVIQAISMLKDDTTIQHAAIIQYY